MSTFQIAAVAADVTDETLNAAPQRALAFIQGAGDPAIRARLATVGWELAHLDAVWELLTALKARAAPLPAADGDPVLVAIAACEAWHATGFICARAQLQLHFPAQAAFVFGDLLAGKGVLAVLNVSTFLARHQALARDPARDATRTTDHDALALLDSAGVTRAELERLAGLVAQARTVALSDRGDPDPTRAEATRLDILRKVYAWNTAWGEIARTVITRRDHLIRLGLAKRRPRMPKRMPAAASVGAPDSGDASATH